MSVAKPQPQLLHHIPLAFVRKRASGAGRKGVDTQIPLVPFIDFLIVLVVFLLSSFSASGELPAARVSLPSAANATDLELAPILAIDAQSVTLDGRRMADTHTLAASTAGMQRIETLVADLETLHRNWSILHPHDAFPGTVIIQADRAIDMRVVKTVMFSAAQAGYANVSFAVSHAGHG
jgi:biopolymer transport protein ExbD